MTPRAAMHLNAITFRKIISILNVIVPDEDVDRMRHHCWIKERLLRLYTRRLYVVSMYSVVFPPHAVVFPMETEFTIHTYCL